MPLFIGDYLADTAHLDTTQHGAYLLLLFCYWRKGGPIMDDPMTLANITRRTPKQWAMISDAVRAFFKAAVIDGRPMLVHTRVEKELLQARGKYESRKAASERANEAKAAALVRISEHRDGDREGDPDGNLTGDRDGPTTTTTTTTPTGVVPLAKANGRKTAPDDPWKQIYDRGKEVFGNGAGGIITNLRKTFADKPRKVLAKIEDAAEKRTPIEWINAFLWEHGPPGIEVGSVSPLP